MGAARSDWHTLERNEVESELGTGPDGLAPGEAADRLRRLGPNRLEEIPPPSNLKILANQFRSPLIYILLGAAAVTALLEEYVDSGVIAVVLVLNAAIGFTQERKAESSVRALMQMVTPHAHVVRGGHESEIESSDLVVGDLVLLQSGARVPADLRLVSTNALRTDESMLTGESDTVHKGSAPVDRSVTLPDRTCMAFAGSVVSSGRGRGYVVATGTDTQLGTISEHVRTQVQPQTPLQLRMASFGKLIGIASGVASLLAFGLGVLAGESLHNMFMVAVALAVAAIPEGLPVVFTITLALGVRRMARRHAVIRRLPAVETLGSTTTIGTDKTGTLTENRMTVTRLWAGGRTVEIGEADPDNEAILGTLEAGVFANESDIGEHEHGDPTETALLSAAQRAGIDPSELRGSAPSFKEIPFESERRYSASVRRRDGRAVVYVKGAPEKVLEMCDTVLGPDGPEPIDPDAVHHAARQLAADGLRVLAMARGEMSDDALGAEVPPLSGLTFCGLQGMLDPPREGVAEAIDACRRAGIRVLMITGDHVITARAIGSRLGIGRHDGHVLAGHDLDAMDDDELGARVTEVPIYARVSPEHKLRVVKALRAHGEVVAVTGDGVNDAPALRAADIGIAMGRAGTDVAREAADMVLTDDNFVSIAAAVEEGRVTFDNVRKVTFFLISTGAASVITILASLVAGWPLPLLPAQLLWLNLVTNGLQDVALAFEPGEHDVLQRRPRSPKEGVVSRLLWERTLIAGAVMSAGTMWMFRTELDRSGSLQLAQTVALTTMVVFMALHVGNSRSEHRSAFALSPVSNPFLLIATVSAVGVHVGALYLPFTQFVLRVEPIPLDTWIRIPLVALTVIAAVEAHKLIRGRGMLSPVAEEGVATDG